MEKIKVSPRILGLINTPTFCGACFVESIGVGFKLPFAFPPAGLMNNLDRFEKGLIDAYFAANKCLPEFLDALDCTEPIEFPRKMTKDFDEYGLTLVGMPDAVFKKTDGSLCVIDYKTSKQKAPGDPLLAIYEVQLLGYVELLEHYGLGEVSSAALVYLENRLGDYKEKPLDLLTREGFAVPFKASIHDVSIDRTELHDLLASFRSYADMVTIPEGREGCENCEQFHAMIDNHNRMTTNDKVIGDLRRRDGRMLQNWMPNIHAEHQSLIADAFRGRDEDELGAF